MVTMHTMHDLGHVIRNLTMEYSSPAFDALNLGVPSAEMVSTLHLKDPSVPCRVPDPGCRPNTKL